MVHFHLHIQHHLHFSNHLNNSPSPLIFHFYRDVDMNLLRHLHLHLRFHCALSSVVPLR